MPIVSHTLETSIQADGGLHVVLRMLDQDGNEFGMLNWRSPPGVDPATRVASRIAEANEQLAAAEFEQIVGAEE